MTYEGAMSKLSLAKKKVKEERVGPRHSNLAARILAGRGATQFPNSKRGTLNVAGRSLA